MLFAWANVEQSSSCFAWLYPVQDVEMCSWVGKGAAGLLLDELDGRNAAVVVGVVELRYGVVEWLDVLHTSRMS